MPIVVDASIAVKFMVREHDTDQARRLLAIPNPLIAPDWLLVEAASTFWKKVRRSELLAVHAERHLADLPRFFQVLHPARDLLAEAFKLSLRLQHSVYDCLYLALAIREDGHVATADDGLIAAADRGGLASRMRRI